MLSNVADILTGKMTDDRRSEVVSFFFFFLYSNKVSNYCTEVLDLMRFGWSQVLKCHWHKKKGIVL